MTALAPATTWGETLKVKLGRRLAPAVLAIHEAVGPHIGTRNTFAKLFGLAGPPTDPTEAFRAWLLVTAMQWEPEEWGLSDSVVPRGYDVVVLRELVATESRWIVGPLSPGMPVMTTSAA